MIFFKVTWRTENGVETFVGSEKRFRDSTSVAISGEVGER